MCAVKELQLCAVPGRARQGGAWTGNHNGEDGAGMRLFRRHGAPQQASAVVGDACMRDARQMGLAPAVDQLTARLCMLRSPCRWTSPGQGASAHAALKVLCSLPMPRAYCTPANRCRCHDSRSFGHFGHMRGGLMPTKAGCFNGPNGSQHCMSSHRLHRDLAVAAAPGQLPVRRRKRPFRYPADSDRVSYDACTKLGSANTPDKQQSSGSASNR